MATKVNEILQFASQDTGSNLLTQSEYDGDAQRVIGHQPGIARSRLENKVLRQCSTMAAGLAQYIFANQDGSVTDSMTPQEVADALSAATGNTTPQGVAITQENYAATTNPSSGKIGNINATAKAMKITSGSAEIIILMLFFGGIAKSAIQVSEDYGFAAYVDIPEPTRYSSVALGSGTSSGRLRYTETRITGAGFGINQTMEAKSAITSGEAISSSALCILMKS